jgi:hypothetical protein
LGRLACASVRAARQNELRRSFIPSLGDSISMGKFFIGNSQFFRPIEDALLKCAETSVTLFAIVQGTDFHILE